MVSKLVLEVFVAFSFHALIQGKGNSVCADRWRPLVTLSRIDITLFIAVSSCQTFADSAVLTLAAGAIFRITPLCGIRAKCFIAADAVLWVLRVCRDAQVPASPVEAPKFPLTTVHGLTVVEKEEAEEHYASPCHQHCALCKETGWQLANETHLPKSSSARGQRLSVPIQGNRSKGGLQLLSCHC